ncbi:MAG: phosphotransferase [Rhodobacteraceae bacterium]|nr:phosphotransferase [Paracoccaceae bacterium]
MTQRDAEKQAFLQAAGWGAARRMHLAGDASARRYERLDRGGDAAVLMDAPPGCGDDAADFLRIADHLAGLGLSPPAVLHADVPRGLVLLEDLGDGLVNTLVAADPGRERPLLTLAAEVLLHLQSAPPPIQPPDLPDLSAADWAATTAIAAEVYARAVTGTAPEAAPITVALAAALAAHADGPRVLILRDYFGGNLLWLPQRRGLARLGLLDFQLAQMGQPEYDLVSLLQDARRDIAPETETAVIARFANARGQTAAGIAPAIATLGALRALRILGVFARLCLVAGKPGYLAHLPRVWGQLQRNLAHPALAELHAACAVLPPPDPRAIERIRARCGSEASP